jgi:hypothetical protein
MIIVRYADDFIVGFEHEIDARRFLDEMRERLGVCAVASFGEDPADRVWTLGGGKPQAARARQTGDLHLPGLHLYLQQNSPGHNKHVRLLTPDDQLGKTPKRWCRSF